MAATLPCKSFSSVALELGLLICLSACGGGNSEQTIPPASNTSAGAPPDFAYNGHGYFIGDVSIAGEKHHSEALLTVDGQVRLYVGGPEDAASYSGAVMPEQWTQPPESMQFVGRIDAMEREAVSGSGTVIGQICDSASARFCSEPARAEYFVRISLEDRQTFLTGELVVMTDGGEERWTIGLRGEGNYYAYPAGRPGQYDGVFVERLAPFTQAEEMTLDIEPDGHMSFASTVSGCTGDGTLLPHLDGQYDVHDVHLVITGCNAQFAYLNSELGGLATETASSPWDYDKWLVIFLSAPEEIGRAHV